MISKFKNVFRRDLIKDALIIFLLLIFVFAYFYQDSGWNENSRFGLIFAFIREGRLSIDNYYVNQKLNTLTGDRAYFDGHYYSDKPIGPALIGALIYKLIYLLEQKLNFLILESNMIAIKFLLTFLTISVPSAITGSLLYILCFYLTKNRFRSFLSTLSITLGTMYFPFSIVFFSHQLTASLLFSSFCLMFFLKVKPEKWKNLFSLIVGLFLGWAIICEYPAVIIVVPLIIYYLSIVRKNYLNHRLSLIFLPMLGGIIPIILQLVNNKLSFNDIFTIGYANLDNPLFLGMQQGLWGIHWPNIKTLFYMTLHPLMGVFWQSPVLIMSILGAKIILVENRYREEAILAAWIICSYFVIMSGYYMWWGGDTFGVRFIVPVLPFFFIFLIYIPDKYNLLYFGLSIVSFGQMLIPAAGSLRHTDAMVMKISTLGFFEFSNIYTLGLGRLLTGKFALNMAQYLLGLNSWFSLIPLLIVMALLTSLFFWEKLVNSLK